MLLVLLPEPIPEPRRHVSVTLAADDEEEEEEEGGSEGERLNLEWWSLFVLNISMSEKRRRFEV